MAYFHFFQNWGSSVPKLGRQMSEKSSWKVLKHNTILSLFPKLVKYSKIGAANVREREMKLKGVKTQSTKWWQTRSSKKAIRLKTQTICKIYKLMANRALISLSGSKSNLQDLQSDGKPLLWLDLVQNRCQLRMCTSQRGAWVEIWSLWCIQLWLQYGGGRNILDVLVYCYHSAVTITTPLCLALMFIGSTTAKSHFTTWKFKVKRICPQNFMQPINVNESHYYQTLQNISDNTDDHWPCWST